jgi:hypothetical protein
MLYREWKIQVTACPRILTSSRRAELINLIFSWFALVRRKRLGIVGVLWD